MKAEQAVENVSALIDAVRTANDNAELAFIGALTSKHPDQQLHKGLALLFAAEANIRCCRAVVLEIAQSLLEEGKNAAAVDGAASRDAVEAGQKTGGNRVS